LEKSGINVSALEDEWINMVDYGKTYAFNIIQDKKSYYMVETFMLHHQRTSHWSL